MDTWPTLLFLAFFLLLGAIVGSFLNVVAYRFNTGKSLRGRSHCLSCGGPLSWYELVPIVSYLLQLGSCRKCRARISPQYVLVEIATGLSFLLVAQLLYADPLLLVLHLGVVSLLIVIAVYDLRHLIIPNELVLYLTPLALACRLWDPVAHVVALPSLDGTMGGLIPAGFFALLWYISRGRWIGLGDAKLAFPLGLIVGAWGSVSMLILAFWIGAAASVGLILMQGVFCRYRTLGKGKPGQQRSGNEFQPQAMPARGQSSFPFSRKPLTIESEVPFAPFLICAFFLVTYAGADAFAVIDAILAYLF